MFRQPISKLRKVYSLHNSFLPLYNFSSTPSFYVQQFNTGCLSEFAYYVESNGEAAIIDPLREVKPYIELAKSRNAKIKYVIETHFHADFVSGHLDLSKATGAKIVYGPEAKAEFNLYSAKDNEELPLGNISLKVLHTPGHTMESSCFLLQDENKKPHYIFTGDTLFLGGVGRPDLAVKAKEVSKEDLAGLLYESLNKKIMPLDDNIIVYPAHGAGSSCGKGISKGTSSTLAEQKKTNYALQPMTKDQFIDVVASDLPTPPKYFFHDAKLNKTNYTNLDEVLQKNFKPLSVKQTKDLVSKGAIIVDCREVKTCLKTGIIPGSTTISLSTPFAIWVGTLLKPESNLIVLTEPGREEEAIIRLARVGFDNCSGFIEGGINEWIKQNEPLEKIRFLDTQGHLDVAAKQGQHISILDVRNPSEWSVGVYNGSARIPLAELEDRISELKKTDNIHILCKSGIRATIAYSILRRNGFENITVIEGGADKLIEKGFKLDQYGCGPTSCSL